MGQGARGDQGADRKGQVAAVGVGVRYRWAAAQGGRADPSRRRGVGVDHRGFHARVAV
jgi:hypothetical protein